MLSTATYKLGREHFKHTILSTKNIIPWAGIAPVLFFYLKNNRTKCRISLGIRTPLFMYKHLTNIHSNVQVLWKAKLLIMEGWNTHADAFKFDPLKQTCTIKNIYGPTVPFTSSHKKQKKKKVLTRQ